MKATAASTRRYSWIFLALALAVWALVIGSYRSHLGFIFDDWRFIFDRMSGGLDAFTAPHHEHIVLLFVPVYRVFIEAFGISSAMPLHIFSMLALAAVAVTLYLYLRGLVGEFAAVLGAIVLLFLGAGYEDLLWIFQTSFSISIATGLSALILLRGSGRLTDLLACLLLVVSVLTVSTGLPFLAGAAVWLALKGDLRRRSFVFLVPAVLFGCWYLAWGADAENFVSVENVIGSPVFVFNAFAYSLGVMTGLFKLGGAPGDWLPRLLAALVLVMIALRARSQRRVPPELILGLTVGLVFWGLAAINQVPDFDVRNFDQSRYQIPNMVATLLILAGGFAGIRFSAGGKAALALVALAALATNLVALSDGYSDSAKPSSDWALARATALDLMGEDHVDPDFEVVMDPLGFEPVTAGKYFATTGRFGHAGLDPGELDDASQPVRAGVDQVLMDANPIVGHSVAVRPSARCRVVTGRSPGQLPTFRLSRTVFINAPQGGVLAAFRFAPETPIELLGTGRTWVRFNPPKDGIRAPWQVQLETPGTMRVCLPGKG